ncbi:hypothetical protein HNP84_010270 [Thermocatellispora tengchongensis]|uniref:Uncharacterized protein n=1 Tax=Thermocatellispora tengchongensis TaxID=1073253 RepID=A0A840PN85_9ACTN|nr:hypothetical protein [Thermocatellispora tengchongensis]
MSMITRPFPRLTRHVVALTAASLLTMAPGIAYADDVRTTPKPSVTATEPASPAETDAPAVPSPSRTIGVPTAAQNAHMGGM